jgi:hypothetical protein
VISTPPFLGMNHIDVETTIIDIHVVNRGPAGAGSPVDRLWDHPMRLVCRPAQYVLIDREIDNPTTVAQVQKSNFPPEHSFRLFPARDTGARDENRCTTKRKKVE